MNNSSWLPLIQDKGLLELTEIWNFLAPPLSGGGGMGMGLEWYNA